MTVDQNIIRDLDQYGHLRFPFGEPVNDVPMATDPDYPRELSDPRVIRAVSSYQDFMAIALEPYIAKHYPERRTTAVKPDGVVGPALAEFFQVERCGMPDYSAAEEPATGPGPWKGCHGIGDFHACSVRFTNNPPQWLAPLLPEILKRVQQAYDEVGLRFLFTLPGQEPEHTPVQINASFVGASSGWIGLALLGERGMSCGTDQLWCRYLHTYKGGSTPDQQINQWTTLLKHELGHNCRYNHTNGGVMNPAIVNGLPVSWRNDPLWNSLTTDFGGVPVPSGSPGPGPGPVPGPGAIITGSLKVQYQGNDLGEYILIPKPSV